jgi:hypothetical protein
VDVAMGKRLTKILDIARREDAPLTTPQDDPPS